MDTGEYRRIGADLKELLHLENPPVAIAFSDSPPAGLKKNAQSVPSGCSFWIMGFKDSFYTDRADHANCNIGSFTHGFLAPQDVSLEAHVDINLFNETGYFPASEFGGVPRMTTPSRFVSYGPLDRIAFEPDIVMIVCNPEQAMIIGEAADSPRLMGAPTCSTIPMSYNDERIGISLGCVTNRIRIGVKSSQLFVTVPESKLKQFSERVRARAKANGDVAQAVTAMLTAS